MGSQIREISIGAHQGGAGLNRNPMCSIRTVEASDWRPIGFQVTVCKGVIHVHGLIVDESSRRNDHCGRKHCRGQEVHDHLCLVDTWSGFYTESPEDMKAAS